jgi:hypothetical protein
MTPLPILISLAVFSAFLFTVVMFMFYNRLVDKRQKLVVGQAAQTTAIVSSLFPKQVMEKLIAEQKQKQEQEKTWPANRLKSAFSKDEKLQDNSGPVKSQIADLFANCSVIFADIVGFTAWSRYVGSSIVVVFLPLGCVSGVLFCRWDVSLVCSLLYIH